MGVIASARAEWTDRELVGIVRAGDETAFEELYRRYSRRVAGYVFRMVGDHDRAEDITQEAFVSALRRLRATDAEIAFKPWIFEIAKNAAIDHFRRASRTEEVSLNPEDGALRPGDQLRLIGGAPAPDAAVIDKERLDHLRGAFDELSESHLRIIVLREFEGLSYREIGERMQLTRPAVESTLFRARRRLTQEYAELEGGARCASMVAALVRLSGGTESLRDERRLGRHLRRCAPCRRHARALGVDVEARLGTGARVAALLPLPAFLRRRRGTHADPSYASGAHQAAHSWAPAFAGAGGEVTVAGWSKAAALVATLAIAGAAPPHGDDGGARAVTKDGGGSMVLRADRDAARSAPARGGTRSGAPDGPAIAKGTPLRGAPSGEAEAGDGDGDELAPGTGIPNLGDAVPPGTIPDGGQAPAVGGPGTTDPIPSETPDLAPGGGGGPALETPTMSAPQLELPPVEPPAAPRLEAPAVSPPGSG